MLNENVYYCTYDCPIKKRCFIVKLSEKPKTPFTVLLKCKALKKDISIMVGGNGTAQKNTIN